MYYDVPIVFDSFLSIPLKRVLMMKFIGRVEVSAQGYYDGVPFNLGVSSR